MIDDNINNLIAMAEQQSDQRLAQELNPETETGLLGPAFIPASELAYRQKIRAEAQAEPNNNPSIVQQLAQTVPPPMQVSMQNEMSMPAAPMPQQQMPPQGFAMGGLIRMANGGLTSDEQETINKIRKDKETKNYIDNIRSEQRGIAGNILSNIAYGAGDADALKYYVEKGKTGSRLTEALRRKGLPPNATQDMVSAYRSGTPISAFVPAVKSGNPLLQESNDKVEQSGSSQARNPNNRNLNTGGGTGLDTTIADIPTNDDVKKILTKTNTTNAPTATTLKTDTNLDINKPKLLHEDIANAATTDIFGNTVQNKEDLLNFQSKYIPKAADKDSKIGALSEYEQLIEDQIKLMTDPEGKMQDKWLRIAAGAFNAAQKGSPTLLGGLADLGGGVTEQLLAFNADEKKQAQELFTLYSAREQLKRTAITTASDQRQQDIENLQKATTAHNNELGKLLDELQLSGYTTEEAESIVAISYADAGVKTAQYNYARGIKQINNKRAELATKHTSADTGILNRQDFLNEFDEFLRNNKHLARYYDNYRDRETAVEDWLLPMLDKI